MLAAIVTSKLIKSPLLVFHATPGAQSATSIQLRKAGETDSVSETPCVAERQDHHNNPHLEYPETGRNSGVSKCLYRLHKKTPQENAPEKLSDLYREDFT